MNIILTCGDCNGIGPEIITKALMHIPENRARTYTLIIPPQVFVDSCKLNGFEPKELLGKLQIEIVSPGEINITPGVVDAHSGEISGRAIEMAVERSRRELHSVIVTAPLHKEAFHLGGYAFPGHTEFISHLCGTDPGTMMFLGREFHSALVTIHEPLHDVSSLINEQLIINTVMRVQESLTNDLGILNPLIALLGLNPHAGENGEIGMEEVRIITPVIKSLQGRVSGPFSADAFFQRKLYKKYHCVVGMYHDQVLIPFKLIHGNRGVNFTSGLPVIRTSPDHGTGFDIAWQGIADYSGISDSIELAVTIAENRYGKSDT